MKARIFLIAILGWNFWCGLLAAGEMHFVDFLKTLYADAPVAAEGEFNADSCPDIGYDYGTTGWFVKNGEIYFKVYDDYLKNWQNPKKNTRNFLWVKSLDPAFLGKFLLASELDIPRLVKGFEKNGNIAGIITASKGAIILIDLESKTRSIDRRFLLPYLFEG